MAQSNHAMLVFGGKSDENVHLAMDLFSPPSEPIPLLFRSPTAVGVCGCVADCVRVGQQLFGRLEFNRDADAQAIEQQWQAGLLRRENASLTVHLAESYLLSRGQEFRGMCGPMTVAVVWDIQSVVLRIK